MNFGFWKFVAYLLKKQPVDPLPNLSGERCASERPERPLFVWTREEAEAAWHANRTEVNLALTLPENAAVVRSSAGIFIVDGKPARVVICVNKSAKQRIHSTQAIQEKKAKEERQKAREKQWLENGCVKDSSGNWTVPDELMWRSLPRGEDR